MGFRVGPWDDIRYGLIDAESSGDNLLLSGVAGKTIIVLSMVLVVASDVIVRFGSGSNYKTGRMSLIASSGFAADSQHGLFAADKGGDLKINLSADVQVGGAFTYVYLS